MKISFKKCFLIVLFIFLIYSTISLKYKSYLNGDSKEREKVLTATMWKLQKEGYTENDIKDIRVDYNYFKGGRLPYNVHVVFKRDTSKEIIYFWDSLNKKEVSPAGETAARKN